ncbi:hypothetical protein BU15DRAFT_67402 [Melanogaster broomeanus]|nr:hypothetical protein BU15DRAFT_67402 [Melanogaster broomeanus]
MKTRRRRGNSSYWMATCQPEACDRAHTSTLLRHKLLRAAARIAWAESQSKGVDVNPARVPWQCATRTPDQHRMADSRECNERWFHRWDVNQSKEYLDQTLDVQSSFRVTTLMPAVIHKLNPTCSHNVKNVLRRSQRGLKYARAKAKRRGRHSVVRAKSRNKQTRMQEYFSHDGRARGHGVLCRVLSDLGITVRASAVYYKCGYGVGFTTHEVTCAERQERFSLAMMNVHRGMNWIVNIYWSRRPLEEVEDWDGPGFDGEHGGSTNDVEGPASINDRPKWMIHGEWFVSGLLPRNSLIVGPSMDLLGLLLSLQGTTWKIGPLYLTVPERNRCCLVSIRGRLGGSFGVIPLGVVVTGWVYIVTFARIRCRG